MKKIFTLATLITVISLLNTAKAQVGFSINVNLGRPAWGLPANNPGDYYYMPDIDVYYNIPQQQFIYMDGGRWVNAPCLPPMYRGYDLYRANKFVINEPRPYLRGDYWRTRYAAYRPTANYYRQPVVVARPEYRDNRYYNNDRRYDNYRQDNRYGGERDYERHDNGRHNGWRR